jgi:hypothetical protein
LQEVTFEEGSSLKRIEDSVFFRTDIDSIQIPKDVCDLSGKSLVGLKSISIESGNEHFSVSGSCVYDLSGRKLIRTFGDVSQFCVWSDVEILGEGCFYECKSLRKVTFETGSSLKRIEKEAFSRSGITSIRIPASVEILCEHCFSCCSQLREVTFEEGSLLRRIEKGAFFSCPLRCLEAPIAAEIDASEL